MPSSSGWKTISSKNARAPEAGNRMRTFMLGKVSIVGAGPGPADLLTVRAATALRAAQVVLHDDLVSTEVLGLCSESAELINVGKRCGKRGSSQERINELMILHARRERSVVRLKSG